MAEPTIDEGIKPKTLNFPMKIYKALNKEAKEKGVFFTALVFSICVDHINRKG